MSDRTYKCLIQCALFIFAGSLIALCYVPYLLFAAIGGYLSNSPFSVL